MHANYWFKSIPLKAMFTQGRIGFNSSHLIASINHLPQLNSSIRFGANNFQSQELWHGFWKQCYYLALFRIDNAAAHKYASHSSIRFDRLFISQRVQYMPTADKSKNLLPLSGGFIEMRIYSVAVSMYLLGGKAINQATGGCGCGSYRYRYSVQWAATIKLAFASNRIANLRRRALWEELQAGHFDWIPFHFIQLPILGY